MNKGQLIVISGPSGAGKGSVLKKVVAKKDGLDISISCTTRKPRFNEVDGVNYYFLTKDEFRNKIKHNELLEYAEVYSGSYYGTPKKNVLDKLNSGIDVILEIDVGGAMQIKENFSKAVLIFIIPPSKQILFDRLRARGTENEDELGVRMAIATEELLQVGKYDYIVINDNIETAVEQVIAIISSDKCRITNNTKIIELIEGGKF